MLFHSSILNALTNSCASGQKKKPHSLSVYMIHNLTEQMTSFFGFKASFKPSMSIQGVFFISPLADADLIPRRLVKNHIFKPQKSSKFPIFTAKRDARTIFKVTVRWRGRGKSALP